MVYLIVKYLRMYVINLLIIIIKIINQKYLNYLMDFNIKKYNVITVKINHINLVII
jgi:hypothetical protein